MRTASWNSCLDVCFINSWLRSTDIDLLQDCHPSSLLVLFCEPVVLVAFSSVGKIGWWLLSPDQSLNLGRNLGRILVMTSSFVGGCLKIVNVWSGLLTNTPLLYSYRKSTLWTVYTCKNAIQGACLPRSLPTFNLCKCCHRNAHLTAPPLLSLAA